MRLTLVLALALLCARGALGITIETVPVGDVGNANDPATGNLYGSINYAYNIGKYEVTVGQYSAFLNAVAATDTYGLYNAGGAIARNGSLGSYSYNVIGSPNHPAGAGWGDAARFANWIHNGQPTGAQDATTTEDGAYTLYGATTNTALHAVTRNVNAKWFIPSESEWYKAAYYQPAAQGGDSDSYWKYPMRTNSVPYSDQPPGATPDNTRVGNLYQNDGMANGYDDGYAVTGSTSQNSNQSYVTDVGTYSSSSSYYGTFDQGGNVWELNDSFPAAASALRGGSWHESVSDLQTSARGWGGFNAPPVGFRVATYAVPEPSSIVLSICICSFLLASRRHRG